MAEGDKRNRLCDILNEQDTGQSLIFVRTKRRADALAKFMEVRGFAVDALHGDMRQTLRQKVLRNFRSGQLRALIATDVAARGIDVAGLSHVINFDLTDTPESYVHRIGRTGRAGLGGLAISFCAPDERNKLGAIIAAVGPRVELFELDGTPVTDFKASGGASRGRRRPMQGARGRNHRDRSNRDDRPAGGRGRPAGKPTDGDRRQTRPAGAGRPEGHSSPNRDSRPNRDARPNRDSRPNRDARPNRDSSFKGRDDQARPSRRGKPSFSDKPTRGDKPSFGSKPTFNKRPNFGDKSAAQKPSHSRGDGGAKRALPAPKKRVGAPRPSRNAKPQGGQGTLKRRR
jgi:ATP-dependent RNA helicase RhlE